METKFVKETNGGKTYIIEGTEKQEKYGKSFSIKRFICEVQVQETEQETQEVADLLLQLNNLKKLRETIERALSIESIWLPSDDNHNEENEGEFQALISMRDAFRLAIKTS